MLYVSLDFESFVNEFCYCDETKTFRVWYEDSKTFTECGLLAIFDHLAEVYYGETYEVIPSIIAEKFSQFSSEVDLLNQYPHPKGIEGLREETTVLDVEGGGFIIKVY